MNHLTENELLELAAGHRIVRRQTQHLAQCSDCTKRLAQTRALITLAQQESPTPMTGTKLQQRLWSTLPPAPGKHQALPLRPIGLVGGVALAAGAALFFAMPGSVVRPTVSFASVEEAMSKIQTVHWTETSELRTPWSFDSDGAHLSKTEKVNVITRDCWSDLKKSQMTQISTTRTPNYLREERTLYDSKYMIHFSKSQYSSSYMKFPYYAFRGKTAARMIVEQIVLPKDDPGRTERFDTGKTVSRVTYSSWKQSEEVRDGKKMLKFVRQVTIERPKDNAVKNVAVWVDKETMRVMRREEVTPASGKYRMQYRRVADNFRYNETPPPGVLELPKPKVGERYRYMDMEGITADKPKNDKAIRALVCKAVDAYNRRDSEAFLALWDWEAVPEAQRRARQSQWREAVIRQTPYVTWHYAAMATGLSAVHEYVRKSESEPFPPPFPTTVDSTLGGWVTTPSAHKPVLVPATFTCTKRSGSWKIQQLQLATKPLPGDWLKGKR